MKTAFAILFSLLLAGTQTAFVGGTVVSRCLVKAGCVCSGCAKTQCCVEQGVPQPGPLPVAPVRTISHEVQSVLPIATRFVELPDTASWEPSVGFLSLLNVSAVPLYQRTCSYRI